MKNEPIKATMQKPVKNSIGRGISSSAMIGPPAWVNLPNKLQMPKAVPHKVVGKIQGVAIWQTHIVIEAPNLASNTKLATSKLLVANLF